jgi:hypothetical protein
MKFTQFVFPHGRKKAVFIDMPHEIESMAERIVAAGFNFEIECFPDTQIVNMDCCNDDKQLACEVTQNGPDVPKAVERLVKSAFKAAKLKETA